MNYLDLIISRTKAFIFRKFYPYTGFKSVCGVISICPDDTSICPPDTSICPADWINPKDGEKFYQSHSFLCILA
jgi:hypothetical protein